MASGVVGSQTSENRDGGNKRTPCPLHGCKRVYTDMNALELHVKEHEIPAQSLPGKVLLCSSVGCRGTFSNMQKLMEHMRHHHKPNIFYMCESCRTKLRSYRGLLTHLHTCSKVTRSKTAVTNTNNANMAAVSNEQTPPWQDSLSSPQQLPPQTPNPEGSFPAVPQPESSSAAAAPAPGGQVGPSYLSHPQSFPYPELTELLPQPPPLNMDGLSQVPEPSDALIQNQTQRSSPEFTYPTPISAPHSSAVSSAVWKKNQGMACSRRILWEHSKGRYTCVQCGHATTNRKEITQHISTQHGGGRAAEDSGSC